MRKKCRKIVKYGLLLGIVLGTNVNTSYGAYTSFVGNGQTVYDEEVDTIEQWVAGGGKTIGTTVKAGGAQAIDTDGLAEDTTVNSGGEQRVVGKATGTIVDAGGTQKVSGTSTGATIGGTQYIYIHGTSTGDTITNGGIQEIDAGGTATGTIVNTGGMQKVSGSSSGATIDGGSQYIYAGGTSTGDSITNGGTQTIYGGGTATGGTLSNGGAQEIYGGGTSTGATLSAGGIQAIKENGLAEDTIIDAGGIQAIEVDGLAEDTIVNDGGEQRVVGAATGTIVNIGGTQKVSGTSTGATIGGVQYIYGNGHSSSETIINGGHQDIALGGESTNATIDAGGKQSVWGTATGSIVNGDQYLYDGSISHNVEVQNGGTIQIMEDGTRLTGQTNLDGGSIYMNSSSPGSFITTTIDHLEGTGDIHMNTNIGKLQGDLITITGGTVGDFKVHLLNQAGAVVDPNRPLILIDNQAGGGSFTLGNIGNVVEVGGFKYKMGQNGLVG